jgi:ferredoxin
MRAEVDLGKCQAYANCVLEAPDVFDLDDVSGKAIVLLDPIPEALHEAARLAEASCPVSAILIED